MHGEECVCASLHIFLSLLAVFFFLSFFRFGFLCNRPSMASASKANPRSTQSRIRRLGLLFSLAIAVVLAVGVAVSVAVYYHVRSHAWRGGARGGDSSRLAALVTWCALLSALRPNLFTPRVSTVLLPSHTRPTEGG
jgi:hypothetical protein